RARGSRTSSGWPRPAVSSTTTAWMPSGRTCSRWRATARPRSPTTAPPPRSPPAYPSSATSPGVLRASRRRRRPDGRNSPHEEERPRATSGRALGARLARQERPALQLLEGLAELLLRVHDDRPV